MATLINERRLTAEEYFALPDDGRHKELVRGRILEMNMPGFEHGEICNAIGSILRQFVAKRGLGRVVSNDSGVLTERDPDTVRGADIAFYSYQRLPKDQRPKRYAGVLAVCVADPDKRTISVYRANSAPGELSQQDHLTLPDVLPKFRVPVRHFFA